MDYLHELTSLSPFDPRLEILSWSQRHVMSRITIQGTNGWQVCFQMVAHLDYYVDRSVKDKDREQCVNIAQHNALCG